MGETRQELKTKGDERRDKRERHDGWINPRTLRFIGLNILLLLHTKTYEKRLEAQIATLLEKVETQRARKDPFN